MAIPDLTDHHPKPDRAVGDIFAPLSPPPSPSAPQMARQIAPAICRDDIFVACLRSGLAAVHFSCSPTLRLLNLGCGNCSEAEKLAQFFARQFGASLSFEGVDPDRERIAEARARHPGLTFTIDSKPSTLSEGKFDLAIVRHPQVYSVATMISTLNVSLLPGAVLFSTQYYHDEYEAMIATLKQYSHLWTIVQHGSRFRADGDTSRTDTFFVIARFGETDAR